MSRTAQFPEVINCRLPSGMTHRLQAVLEAHELQGVLLREMIVDMVLERERTMAPMIRLRKPPSKGI